MKYVFPTPSLIPSRQIVPSSCTCLHSSSTPIAKSSDIIQTHLLSICYQVCQVVEKYSYFFASHNQPHFITSKCHILKSTLPPQFKSGFPVAFYITWILVHCRAALWNFLYHAPSNDIITAQRVTRGTRKRL